MKGATGYEDEGSLKNPVNQMVAVLPHDVHAKVVVQALHKAGISSEVDWSAGWTARHP